MRSDDGGQSNFGLAVVAWICVFAASSVLIAAMTKSQGLGLVWGVFVALFAFEISRQSFRHGLIIILLSLLTVFLVQLYSLLQ